MKTAVSNALDQPDPQDFGWISALDAAYLLSTSFGGDDRAKSQLLARLQDGTLTCRAYCWCQEADIGAVSVENLDWGDHKRAPPHSGQRDTTIFKSPPKGQKNINVPPDVLLKTEGWKVDHDDIDWTKGYIIARRPVNLNLKHRRPVHEGKTMQIRRFVFGLDFRKDEILAQTMSRTALAPADEPEQKTSDIRNRPGPKRSRLWEGWTAEVVLMAVEGALDVKLSHEKLFDEIEGRLNLGRLESPDFEAAKATIAAIKNRLKRATQDRIKKGSVGTGSG